MAECEAYHHYWYFVPDEIVGDGMRNGRVDGNVLTSGRTYMYYESKHTRVKLVFTPGCSQGGLSTVRIKLPAVVWGAHSEASHDERVTNTGRVSELLR